MKVSTLAAACAAVISLSATAAFAGETAVTAKLQQPVSQPTKFIAGGAVFVCETDTCVAQVPMTSTFATATCKQVAAKAGPVASFAGRKSFDEARLAECNASLGKTALAKQ